MGVAVPVAGHQFYVDKTEYDQCHESCQEEGAKYRVLFGIFFFFGFLHLFSRRSCGGMCMYPEGRFLWLVTLGQESFVFLSYRMTGSIRVPVSFFQPCRGNGTCSG